jgi:hypothetical protein
MSSFLLKTNRIRRDKEYSSGFNGVFYGKDCGTDLKAVKMAILF